MTRNELVTVGRRVYDALYGVIIGPSSKGGTAMSETQTEATAPDPRDAEIAELRQQLAEAQAQQHDTSTDKGDPQQQGDEPEPEPAPAEVSYAEAKAKVDANENLTDADVAALERGPQG